MKRAKTMAAWVTRRRKGSAGSIGIGSKGRKRRAVRRSVGKMVTVVGLAGLSAGASFGAHAQAVRKVSMRPAASATVEDRWRESFDAFAASDKLAAPQQGGVLFVGSSSIRLWGDLESQFTDKAGIVKRGFGGSRMADVARYVDQLVLPYKPHLVIVYAGDNDLAEGRSPEDVLASFAEFTERVQDALPDVRIAYVSIKPSPLRASLMPLTQRTNALIERYTVTMPNVEYIDVYSKMLDAQGRPRADLYMPDALHLNASGYSIWKTAITAHLQPSVGGGEKYAGP